MMLDPDMYEVDAPLADFDMVNANEEPVAGEDLPPPSPVPIVINCARIDLDSVMKEYCGYGLMNRLLFIADVCPPLRYDALRLLIEYTMKNTQNVNMIMSAYHRVEKAKQLATATAAPATPDNKLQSSLPPPPLNQAWVEQTTAKAQSQLDAYLTEFKRQKDEGVKESIRRSLNEVVHQYVQMGQLQEALTIYARGMREFCTAPNYVLQMLINWINITVYAEQWQKLAILLPQAERAIAEVVERESVGAGPMGVAALAVRSGATASQPNSLSRNYKELVQSSQAKIAAVSGLLRMQEKQYRAAADKFITVDLDALDYPQLLSAGDVAVYGTLCALAAFNRAELKERVLGSTLFRKSLESEPKLVELLQKFTRSEFAVCLDILNELRDQLLLNMYLAPHLHTLYGRIRQSAIVQYFQPYTSASIAVMAQEFRCNSVDEIETDLISLIDRGLLGARIDSHNKVLHAKVVDRRVEVYNRAFAQKKALTERVHAILLRAAFVNNKLCVGESDNTAQQPAGGGSGASGSSSAANGGRTTGGSGVGGGGKSTRRRSNPTGGHANNVNGGHQQMEADENAMDGSWNEVPDTATATTAAAAPNRLINQVHRLLNAATSRIHSNIPEPSNAPASSSSSSGDVMLEPVPPSPGTASMGPQPPASSDMELELVVEQEVEEEEQGNGQAEQI